MGEETCAHDTFLSPFTWRYSSQDMRTRPVQGIRLLRNKEDATSSQDGGNK